MVSVGLLGIFGSFTISAEPTDASILTLPYSAKVPVKLFEFPRQEFLTVSIAFSSIRFLKFLVLTCTEMNGLQPLALSSVFASILFQWISGSFCILVQSICPVCE